MTGLWDTNGEAVARALAAERRGAGGAASGLALTLVVIADEPKVRAAEAAATVAASEHPCRLLIVMRSDESSTRSRLDAEVLVGGRLGPCEAVVMRMLGPLAAHADSVVTPLLAPDVPVVTWWQGAPPDRIGADPLGVVAERRVTDSTQAPVPLDALRARAEDYLPGDSDLAWTQLTPWRSLIAGIFDAPAPAPVAATVQAAAADPSAALLCGWLSIRLGVQCALTPTDGQGLTSVHLDLADGGSITLRASGTGQALLTRSGAPDRALPLVTRPLGEQLAEELRRLGPDPSYAAALGAATGVTGTDVAAHPGTVSHFGARLRTWAVEAS